MSNFGHLHVHTEYSLLDGAGKMEEMLKTAKSLKQDFIAITDHGSMSGLWEAQKLGKEIGIKVLLGCEFYYQNEKDSQSGHLIVLAKSDKGLENMMKLHEFSYVENFNRKPRILWEELKKHKEGLVVTSACLGSTINQYILAGDMEHTKEWIRNFKETFGEDFYLEIQPNQIPEQIVVNQTLIRLAKEFNIKIIATNDVHYVFESDSFPHEVLLAMQVQRKMSDTKRWKFPTVDFWLKSEEEMLNTFVGLDIEDMKTAINNTKEIADKCNAEFHKGNYLPEYYNIHEGSTARSILVQNTMEGARNLGMNKDKTFMQEVQNEINVIDRNGYSGYFLIVGDYVNSARSNGVIVGDGRGSGAGSKVAWLTGITKIPPHNYDLLFERFLADGREPDFDVDFSDQDAVFNDLASKYGWENVARIVAFGTMTPKAVTRKVLSTFEHDMQTINSITKLIPDKCDNLEDAYKQSEELMVWRRRYKVEFEVAERLQGVISHEGQHAGGVIICKNLSSVLPVKTKAENRNKRIVAFDANMLHDLGHFKFDVLGLETLPIIKRCVDSINKQYSLNIDLHEIDLENKNVYDMLCAGDVSGIFQINNQAGKVIEQQPKNFRDLIAINALIRPGTGDWEEYIARRKGKPWSVHPARMPYLKETEGLITYQEQFLLDCKVLAGWDIAFADKNVRKNKDIRNDHELHEKFIRDAMTRNFDKDEMEDVWSEIENAVAGGYSFNKSHSASYAIISYQTAWLKYYYPKHFYASLMTSDNGQDEVSGYIAECKQRGIKILPPDINKSEDVFIASDEGINYRITTITAVGDSAIEGIKQMRPIKNFNDFIQRRNKNSIKKNVIVNLIKAGCFDFDNPNRAELLWTFDMMCRTKTEVKNNYQCPTYDWNDKIKAMWENDVLGMYLSVHPLEKYGFKPLTDYADGQNNIIQGGEIYEIKTLIDKNKNEMAFVFINTLYGNVKILCFASAWQYKTVREAMKVGNIILVRGKRSGKDVILNSVEVLNDK